jgi:hypothetical protein
MHQRECHRIGVPFTDLEAENAQASNAHVNNHNVHSTPSEASDDVVEGRGLNHVDMEQIADDDDDDDDYPNIADWIADATAGGEVDLSSPAHNTDTSVLDNVFYKRVVNTSESSAPPTLINHLKSFYHASTLCPSSTIK